MTRGDLLATIETDKVSNELEAEADGVLKILMAEGEDVGIGTVIATIEEAGAGTDGKNGKKGPKLRRNNDNDDDLLDTPNKLTR